MERAEILSEILRDQIRSGAPRESLLWTLGMIRTEILAMPTSAGSSSGAILEHATHAVGAEPAVKESQPEVTPAVSPLSDPDIPWPAPSLRDLSPQPSPAPDAAPVHAEAQPGHRMHQVPPVEVNQRVVDGGSSLNDMLRQAAPELAERLVPEAVTDLRRAFGINDRFRLINELFGGDGAAFDEAVVRLNGMPGMAEAIDFIDRGLSARRGWDAADPLVEQLRQSVRRRFSSM